MAEQSSPNWIDAWTEIQRKSWESWSQIAQQALTGSHPTATDPWRFWQQGFQGWREMLAPNVDPATQDVYRKLLDQGMGYMRMNHDMLKTFQSMQVAAQMGGDWMKAVYNVFDEAKDACAKMSVEGNDLARGCLALWGLPLDTWRRVASSMSLFPGDRLQAFKLEDARHVGDTLHANLQRFLSIPPVGYTREWQELGQQAGQSWLEYQQAQNYYVGVVAKVGGRTLELMQRKLVEMATAGKRIESLRQLYDLWVDCGEDAYAEVTSAAEFGEASARLVTAAMALKRQSQRIMDEMASTLNMPSRPELDSAHYRVHQLKREVKALEQGLKELRGGSAQTNAARGNDEDKAIQDLRREIESLREALEEVRAEPARATAGVGAGEKARTPRTARSTRSKGQPSQAKGE